MNAKDPKCVDVKDAYNGLKVLNECKFASKPSVKVVLTELKKKPDVWKAPL
jgi:hypothetical protein